MGPYEPTRYQNADAYREALRSCIAQRWGFAILSTLGRYSPAGRPFFRHPLRKYSRPRRRRRGQRHHAVYNERRNMVRVAQIPPPRPLPAFPAPSIPPYYTVAMQVWGFLLAALACDVCERPYTLEHRHGRYLWVGSRTPPMRAMGKRARSCRRKPPRLRREPRPIPSLHIVVMWLADYTRGVVFGEMELIGFGAPRGRPVGSISYNPKVGAPKNPTLDMGAAGRPRPGSARQTLTEWQGRVQLQMALAYHRVVLRPTYQKTLNAHWPQRAKSPVTPI